MKYGYIQEGGSSVEFYLAVWDSAEEAEAGRAACAKATYRTTPVFEIIDELAAFGEDLYSLLEEVVRLMPDLEYAEEAEQCRSGS